MTVTDQTLSLLLHSPSKSGKTTLGSTAPAPRLILDAEGGTKFLPQRRCLWDPTQTAPPEMSDCETCVVVIRDYESMQRTYQWLASGQHQFRSVIVDSITEVQRRCKQVVSGMDAPDQRQWGAILMQMESLIRNFRDLTTHPTNPLEVVAFIAETRQDPNGKWKPYVQGQLSVSLPYLVDIVGYLFVQDLVDENGAPLMHDGVAQRMRRLLIAPHPQYETGERVQGRLGDVVDNPNIESMLHTVYPNGLTPTNPDGGQ